jgi:alkylation response protein AidB-like acyl-CoA dehydrogenase
VVFDAAESSLVLGCDGESLFTVETGDRLDSIVSMCPERLERWMARALALISADLLGVMSGTLTEAVAHTADRVQYGRPIGSFQAVQHLCADQLVTIEATRSSIWHAAWASDVLAPQVALEAARLTKIYCTSGALEVTEAAIQVWGGLGMTWEVRAHLFLRRALLSRLLFGDHEHHRPTADVERRSAMNRGLLR